MSLKALRNSRHFSQQQLALLSGLNVRTIQRIESGHTASIESLKCLASVFELDISELQQEIIMAEQHAVKKDCTIKTHKVEINTLLIVGGIFIVFGAPALQAEPYTSATFYLGAGFCFVVAALKMFRHRIYC
ncbi:helix-turn-helix domain-containing protein [Neptunicella sp. SCSIO 80796]|uniref:helix-turn-helix domain-containing protein n=1 Tax=Neptunicella plasticusilytica TaxID=3117012 RepID=UPI003A4D7806